MTETTTTAVVVQWVLYPRLANGTKRGCVRVCGRHLPIKPPARVCATNRLVGEVGFASPPPLTHAAPARLGTANGPFINIRVHKTVL